MYDIPAAVTAVSQVIGTVLNRVLPREKMSEKDAADIQRAIESELLQADWQQIAGQLAINQAEAGHASIFVAGWRPFIGWVCGGALAYHYVFLPFLLYCVGIVDPQLAAALPKLDASELTPILTGMLGLGGLRTFEKIRGVARGR